MPPGVMEQCRQETPQPSRYLSLQGLTLIDSGRVHYTTAPRRRLRIVSAIVNELRERRPRHLRLAIATDNDRSRLRTRWPRREHRLDRIPR